MMVWEDYKLSGLISGAKSVPRIDDNENMPCIASVKQRISAIQGIENTS